MEFRRVFNEIPEAFDRWRPRYCQEAFDAIIGHAALAPGKSMLEIGPGTGQATMPFLRTGCDYLGIELGDHLAALLRKKCRGYDNFRLIQDDFITHDFGAARFDLILSAATIQWIDEDVAFPKCFALLKEGGVLAMMFTRRDYRTPNEALYQDIQRVYSAYFHPETPYTRRFAYDNAPEYGFTNLQRLEFHTACVYTADEYAACVGTHCDHIVLREPDRSLFFSGIRDAIRRHGNAIKVLDTVVVYLARRGQAAAPAT